MTSLHMLTLLPVVIFMACCGRDQSAKAHESAKPVEHSHRKELPHWVAPVTFQGVAAAPVDQGKVRRQLVGLLAHRKSDSLEDASQKFGQLLPSMNCVGRPLAEIRVRLGEPDMEDAHSITYRFSAGWGGWDWVFKLDGGKIISVERQGVN